jgi:hypothetical protein
VIGPSHVEVEVAWTKSLLTRVREAWYARIGSRKNSFLCAGWFGRMVLWDVAPVQDDARRCKKLPKWRQVYKKAITSFSDQSITIKSNNHFDCNSSTQLEAPPFWYLHIKSKRHFHHPTYYNKLETIQNVRQKQGQMLVPQRANGRLRT